MNDPGDRRDEGVLDPAFDDPGHDAVRRMLADARVDEPVPADVAARLDATLAALQEERSAPAPVVPLRRRFGRVLVAAAAVVVVGAGAAGIAQVARTGPGSGSADRAAGGSVTSSRSDSGTTSGGTPKSVPHAPRVSGLQAQALPRLTTARFGGQVSQLMRATYAADVSGETSPGTDDSESPTDGLVTREAPAAPPVTQSPEPATGGFAGEGGVACAGPQAPGAIVVPATLDGGLVALVFRPPTADAQVVEAWSCDGATLLASVSVPH